MLFRTSGILTSALSPCHQSYLALLRQALGDLAQLHVLTDLSLSLAPDLAAAELRRLSDTHQQKLSQQLNGIPTFAYTVADIVAAFPSVAWPIPGELHPTAMLNNDTRLWLSASWEHLEARGMRLTRRLETGRVVSNLLSYYVHEPSLCVWLRRRQLASGDDVARRVWVLEEDVLFLGDVRRALLPFANSSADLIAVFQPSAYIDAEWWLHVNPAFRAALPGRPLHKWEHVERYSVALLLKLEDLLQRGAAAYGELFGSTPTLTLTLTTTLALTLTLTLTLTLALALLFPKTPTRCSARARRSSPSQRPPWRSPFWPAASWSPRVATSPTSTSHTWTCPSSSCRL